MTHQLEDRDLADRFARLRRDERTAAPAFADVTTRRVPERIRRGPLAIGLAAAVVAAIAIGLVASRDGTGGAPLVIDLRATSWTAPTDFLLDTPGNWMLRDLPKIAAPASMKLDTTSTRRTSS